MKDPNAPALERRCALCGQVILPWETDHVVGLTGQAVCRSCLMASRRIPDLRIPEAEQFCPDSLKTPGDIIAYLDRAIIGQEAAKKAVAIALWKQQLRAFGDRTVPHGNLLLYGPSGCGKTAIVQEAAKAVDLPFMLVDSTSPSEAGYKGKDAVEIIRDMEERFRDHPRVQYGIVFLDEIDKLAAQGNEVRAAYSRGTQSSLLKIIEGIEVPVQRDQGISRSSVFSTEDLLFIFGGAFSRLKETKTSNRIGFCREQYAASGCHGNDISVFVEYGMEPELMGRLGQCVPLYALTAAELRRILLESSLSVYRQYQAFFLNRGIKLECSDEVMDQIVRRALDQGTGARGLNAVVEQMVAPLLFQLSKDKLSGTAYLREEAPACE